MNKRKWCYAQKPVVYDVWCDKCGGTNTTWSEYEHMIWCYDCQPDTKGTPGIFDGPIPIQVAECLGVRFDRINLETDLLEICVLKDNGDLEWISEEEFKIRKAVNTLAEKEVLDT